MHEEEWSYIPVGGPLPLPDQPAAAFGAAASLVHPATGYSITRSLREAPAVARACAQALTEQPSSAAAVRFVWEALWTQERRRQVRAGRHDWRAPSACPTPLAAHCPFCLHRLTARLPRHFLSSLPSPCAQTSFQVFGMELLCQLDTRATADFFTTFFRLPASFWRGFLASKLSSGARGEGAAGA